MKIVTPHAITGHLLFSKKREIILQSCTGNIILTKALSKCTKVGDGIIRESMFAFIVSFLEIPSHTHYFRG